MSFDVKTVQAGLDDAFQSDSEVKLLEVLKNNSFLFSKIYSRNFGIQPNFAEVPFGNDYRCDFCWLNDNSDGPEWVLVEVEKPNMRLFNKSGDPSAELNHALEQVKSWERYFERYPAEKARIFGAVSRFRFVLIAGRRDDWQESDAAFWRAHHNKTSNIEIHSTDVFYDSLDHYIKFEDHFWSFKEHPKSLPSKNLTKMWAGYDYMRTWRNLLT